jgi:glucose/arabinose dehydrogenase
MVFASWGRTRRPTLVASAFALVAGAASAQTRSNPNCPVESVFYNPGTGQDIVVPKGFEVSVFAKDLNFPTGLAFQGSKDNFRVFVVESGKGLPAGNNCNNNDTAQTGGPTSPTNPFTPDLMVFDSKGRCLQGRPDYEGGCANKTPIGKPNAAGRPSYQVDGPAIGLAFENGARGGTLFGTDSNQGARGAAAGKGGGNNSSRVVTIDVGGNAVKTLIGGLPTGDHPTELIVVKDGFIYWSQGSATNSGVTGHDNGNGGNQHDIACQDIRLSNNTWSSGDGHRTSGFSNHGIARPGALVPAFEDATKRGMCTGAILRAPIHTNHPEDRVEPVSWGYRNPFGLQFAPDDHALQGGLFVTENGEDERGARPTNNAPDRLQLARQNRNGSPDFHGWPDRFGFLDSTQAVFNPVGGPGDDLCPAFPVCRPDFVTEDIPVRPILDHFPQAVTAPLAIEPSDVAAVGPDFAPNAFTGGVVKTGAALVAREGDFGFSKGNGEPEAGHDIELVNFSKRGEPLRLSLSRFAFNCRKANQTHDPDGTPRCRNADRSDASADQAFTEMIQGINRPIQVLFGPDGAAYLVDFGAVRDFGQSDPRSRFIGPTDGPLVQIPKTGVIWKISRKGGHDRDDDD